MAINFINPTGYRRYLFHDNVSCANFCIRLTKGAFNLKGSLENSLYESPNNLFQVETAIIDVEGRRKRRSGGIFSNFEAKTE